jgi:hypothetical protein
MDETQPHIHFAFVPIVPNKKRGGFKVSAKERVNKTDLLKFHPDLSQHMREAFGHDIGIENGATALGNQTVVQLKAGEELKKELSNDISELQSQQSKEQSQLDKIAKKKADVKAVESMEVKHTIFGGKVTVAADDFENLQTLAQKQIVSAKSTKKLKSEVADLKAENRDLSDKVVDLTAKAGKSIKLQIENEQLQKKVGFLQSMLDKVLDFVAKFGLREKLEQFLNLEQQQTRTNQRNHER